MSNIEVMGTKLHNAQHRIAILSHNVEAFLTQPALLSVVMEELAVVLEEVQQQYEEVLVTRLMLENQRQHYQELFDFAPDGYLVTDAQGVIQEANQAAVSLFGARQAFLVGKPLVLLVANVDRRAFRDYITRCATFLAAKKALLKPLSEKISFSCPSRANVFYRRVYHCCLLLCR